MDKIKIKVGNEFYLVEVAQTDEEKEKGLQNRESLPEKEGMLFLFDDDREEVSI